MQPNLFEVWEVDAWDLTTEEPVTGGQMLAGFRDLTSAVAYACTEGLSEGVVVVLDRHGVRVAGHVLPQVPPRSARPAWMTWNRRSACRRWTRRPESGTGLERRRGMSLDVFRRCSFCLCA